MRNSPISHDAVFIAMEEWGRVWRRSQNLAVAYARRFPERSVLYVETSLDLTHALRTRQFKVLRQVVRSVLRFGSIVHIVPFANLKLTRPLKILPDSFPGGRQFNQALTRWQVRRAIRSIQMNAPVFWINPYWGSHYVGKMGEVCALYDVGDDWNAIKQSPRAMRWTRQDDQAITKCADAVIVVSDYLRRQKSQSRNDVFLIPNGIDTERYADIWKRTLPVHSSAAQWRHPVLGYIGMLHAERLDIGLLCDAAKAFPEATITLIGPNYLSDELTAQLTALPNARIVEAVSYPDVPFVMAAFDVCLVPNLVNDFSESQNPLKLFEYLASGLPIVSTNIAGFRDYPDLVRIADTPQEFIQGIRDALVEGTAKAELRQAAVQSETWDARLDALLEVIEYAKAKRQK